MGKILSEINKAYIAGLLDGDGSIMACIERHKEKKYKFRIRVYIKISQKGKKVLLWIKDKIQFGYIIKNRTTYDWIMKDQQQILKFVELICPLLIVKKKQAILAKRILEKKIESFSDLKNAAKLADKLASLNIRSKNRRKNFNSIVVKKVISPND